MTGATVAGRYEVERTLGHGGMATVYLARDEALDRPVALKVLAGAGDESFHRRFLREARLAARLSHPNVVRVYDAGEADGAPYIVMEYVPGETVGDLLARRRGKLAPAEAVALAVQACEALEHAHRHGLVHRDIKPQNLLVRDDGCLKVADFGIARADESTRLTQHGTILGTAAYLSPEQAAGGDVTAATDLYSLGAVLYELLTGRTPYTFSSLAELAAKQGSGDIVPPRDLDPAIPAPLEAVVMRCLARDPRFRPDSAGELAADLSATLDTQVYTPDTTATAVLRRRGLVSARGSRAWRWLAVAAVVAVIAVAFGLTRGGGGSSSPATRTQPTVASIPPGATAADEARSLGRWLRRYSR